MEITPSLFTVLCTLYYALCTMHCSMKKNRNKTDEINKKLSLLGERLVGLQAEVCDGETVLCVMVRLCVCDGETVCV